GNAGDLETAVVKDGAGTVLENRYSRYSTTSSPPAYAGGLKYAVTGDAYERMEAWADAQSPAVAVDDLTDAQVAVFATDAFEYDAVRRVTRHTQPGTGGSVSAGGRGTSTVPHPT